MKKIALALFSVAIPLYSFPALVTAQDHNYWTNQFGTRSSLMGGSVVGGVRDTSALFYNPGALGFIDHPSLSVSATAYKFEQTTLENGVGTEDLDSDEVNVVPLLLSGVVKFDGAPEHSLGYGVLTKNRATLKTSARRDVSADVLNRPSAPGAEDYIGQYSFDSSLNEVWGGLAYAYRPSSTAAFGLTNFVTLRTQRESETVLARAINQENLFEVGTAETLSTTDLTVLNVLWKAGAAFDLSPVKIGLTLTTPGVNIYGDGTSGRDLTVTNLDFADVGPIGLVADDRQEGLDAEIKSPLSIAAGLTYDASEKTKLAVSAEWFDNIGRYSVVEPEDRPFVRPTTIDLGYSSADFLRIESASDSTINVAVGLEHQITDKVSGIVSFRTDNEVFEPIDSDGLGLGYSNWDIYHVTAGAMVRGENSDLSIGLVYSFGSTSDYAQAADFGSPTEGNLLLGEPSRTDADYNALSILVGYTYYIS